RHTRWPRDWSSDVCSSDLELGQDGASLVYPPENARLMRQVEERGAVLSQFPPGTPPLPYNFPTRNRTLAGLALGVVVVEAGERRSEERRVGREWRPRRWPC